VKKSTIKISRFEQSMTMNFCISISIKPFLIGKKLRNNDHLNDC